MLDGLFGGNTVFERSVPVAPVRALLFEFEFVVAGVVMPPLVVPLVDVPLLVPVVEVVGAVVCEPSGVVWLGLVELLLFVVELVDGELVVPVPVALPVLPVLEPVPVDPVDCASARLVLSATAVPINKSARMFPISIAGIV